MVDYDGGLLWWIVMVDYDGQMVDYDGQMVDYDGQMVDYDGGL